MTPKATTPNHRTVRAWTWSLALVIILGLGLLTATTLLVTAQTVSPQNGPILRIDKTAHEQKIAPGERLTYTLTISNSGDISATGVVVTDVLPAHTTFAQADQGGQITNTQTVQWSNLTVNAGSQLILTFAVTVEQPLTDGTPIVNERYAVTCTEGSHAAGQAVTVTVVSTPQLHITKTANTDRVLPGAVLPYTLVVSNDGNGPATGVVVTDVLPAHTTFAQADQGGQITNTQTVQWSNLTVNAGSRLTLTFAVIITHPLADDTPIVNRRYAVTCTEGSHAAGQAVTVTAYIPHIYLPLVVKSPPPPACDEYLQNGGFEEGDAHWTQWSAGGWDLIFPSSQITVHNESGWGAWLAGYNNAHDELCQTITIPTNRLSATATWWWQMKTYQHGSAGDTIRLEVRPSGETLGELNNLGKSDTWLQEGATISTTGVVTLCFIADTDDSLITDFYVDDVSVRVCVPGE